MKNNMQNIRVPFPIHMMSSSRSEYNMPTEYAKYVKNMIINHTGAGSKRNGFSKVDYDLPVTEKVIKLKHFPNLNGDVQILAFTASGNVYKRFIDSEWELIFSGFSESNHYSIASFDGQLIVCNGIDVGYSYNGETFSKISQYISQKDFYKQRSSSSSVQTDMFKENFPIGKEVKIELKNGEFVYTTVSHYSESIDPKYYILHFTDSVITENVVDIQYKLYCPVFSRVYAFHDRLWAMGKGDFEINKLSSDKDKSRIFYTNNVNNASSWFDSEGNPCSINLADKIPENEELVGMATKDSMTIFFFRSYSQIWQGTNPKSTGDFTWVKTLPIGLSHPELLIDMPNDLGFFSQFGARTFSRILQTEQLDIADMGSEMATDIHNAIEKIRLSSKAYKNIHSFGYHKQNWFAFKLDDEVLIFQLSQGILSWSRFDGFFANATAFLNTPDGNLYAMINNELYLYNTKMFSDNGNPIHTVWMTPWFDTGNSKLWANKYTEILVEPSALKTAEVRRFKNYNSASYVIKEINLKSLPDYFDNAYWDNAYYDSAIQEKNITQDKYVANNMAYSIQTNDNEGPLTINGLKLYGSKEK